MRTFDKLERRLGWLAIPGLPLIFVLGQAAFFLVGWLDPAALDRFSLNSERVLKGEYWRVVSFVFLPPVLNPICLFFGLYIFYLMGSALEHEWGTVRFNVYVLLGFLSALAVAFFLKMETRPGIFIAGSVFLAFAHLYPDFELYIFFLLPVKVKYLALVTWIGFALAAIFGEWSTRAFVGAAALNFLVFFGRDVAFRIVGARRRMATSARHLRDQKTPFHRCEVCGITELSHPRVEFRVCTACTGSPEYCGEHIRNHEHRTSSAAG